MRPQKLDGSKELRRAVGHYLAYSLQILALAAILVRQLERRSPYFSRTLKGEGPFWLPATATRLLCYNIS